MQCLEHKEKAMSSGPLPALVTGTTLIAVLCTLTM